MTKYMSIINISVNYITSGNTIVTYTYQIIKLFLTYMSFEHKYM